MSVLVKNVNWRGETLDLLVEAGTVRPARWLDAGGAEVIEGAGLTMFSAFRDDHVHFRDPGQTEKEDLLSGARAATAGGYARVACEANTRPVVDSPEAVDAFYAHVEELQVPVDLRTKIALTVGQQGVELIRYPWHAQFPEAVAQSSDGEPVVDRALLRQALGQHPIDVHLHCEETPASSVRVAAALGAGPSMAREPELVRLAIEVLAELGGSCARLMIQHVSMAETVELIERAQKSGLWVWGEVTPHHLLLCEEDIPRRGDGPDPNWKMNPPLRSRTDMMAMRRALALGIIDTIATDHAPHTPAEKARPWDAAPFGVIGLETAFAACNAVVQAGDVPLSRIVSATGGDLDVLCASDFPHDLVLIDPNHVWTVDPDKFYSKSRNCPFAGMTFKGRPMYTIINGKVVMAEGEVLF